MCYEGLHDPFAGQVACARYRAERDALAQRMEEVASEIDRTLSGVEGIEDAPAMRWMRGLREALGSLHAPRIGYEDIEAARWVRGHGGLDKVKRRYYQRPVLDADGVPIKEGDTVWPKYPYEEPDRQVESAEVVYVHRLGRIDIQAKYATGMSFRQQVDAEQLTHTKPEPPKRCQDCRFWQKDPTARTMGVCWRNYAERDCEDSYEARVEDAPACEYFDESGE